MNGAELKKLAADTQKTREFLIKVAAETKTEVTQVRRENKQQFNMLANHGSRLGGLETHVKLLEKRPRQSAKWGAGAGGLATVIVNAIIMAIKSLFGGG